MDKSYYDFPKADKEVNLFFATAQIVMNIILPSLNIKCSDF